MDWRSYYWGSNNCCYFRIISTTSAGFSIWRDGYSHPHWTDKTCKELQSYLTLARGSLSCRDMMKSLGSPPMYTPVLLPIIVPVAQSLVCVPAIWQWVRDEIDRLRIFYRIHLHYFTKWSYYWAPDNSRLRFMVEKLLCNFCVASSEKSISYEKMCTKNHLTGFGAVLKKWTVWMVGKA